ncbi:protein kinase domain-containing protein [Pseudonocardia saturnea]
MDVRHVGPYRLERLLGFGGMGEVHLAYDTVRERTVALKLLSEALSKDTDYQRRFRHESHVAARLREPHVIPIHDYGEVDGQLFIDMRLVDGKNVREILSNGGAMPPERVVHLVGQVADALEAAHADGLVHRDIKPSNVLVTANDFVYVVDFGIARSVGTARSSLTLTGVTVGTLDYMAPERFSRSNVDGRADVYSLACLLFECLTGTPPFAGDDLPSLMHAHLYEDPPRPSALVASLPAAMDAVIARGMAKDLDARFSTPAELADAARAALGGTAASGSRGPGSPGAGAGTPVAEKSGAGKSEPEMSGTAKPAAEKPAAEQPAAEQPAAEQPGAEQPGAGKAAAEKPGSGRGGSDEQAPGAPDRPATAARASGAHRSAAPASEVPRSGAAASGASSDLPGSRAATPAAAAVAAGAGRSGPAEPAAPAAAAPAAAAAGSAAPRGDVTSANDLLGALGAVHVPGGSPLAGPADPAFNPTAAPKPVAPPAGAAEEPVTAKVAVDRTPAPPAQAPTPVPPPTPPPAAQDGPTVMFANRAAAPVRPARPGAREPDVPGPARRRGPLLTVAAVLVVAALVVTAGILIGTGTGTGAGPSAPVANPLAVPPADEHDHDSVVSIAVPTVRGSIPVGPTPGYMEIAPNGRFAYIANRDAGVVTVLDTAINTVTSAIPIEAGPPQFVAFSPDGLRAYVSIYNTERTVNLVGVLDTTTNTVVATIPVGRRPFASATTPDGSRLYVPSHDDGRIDVIDTATNTVVAEIPVAPNPHWVAFAPDGSRLYAANHESNLVSVIDPANNSVLATIPVGTSPHSTTLSPDGTRAAVVNFDSSEVSVIDTATNTVVATVPVGLKPQDIAYSADGRFLYTANVDADTVSVIDTGTNQVTAVIPAGDGPTSVAVSRDGRTAYVTILNAGSVLMLDLTAT